MLPVYSPRIRNPQTDDIRRAVERYGRPQPTTPPTPSEPGTPASPAIVPSKINVLMADNSVWQFDKPVKIR